MKTMLAMGSCFECYNEYALYRWIDHYQPFIKSMNINEVCIFNDGPKGLIPAYWILEIDASKEIIPFKPKPITIFTWPNRLGRYGSYNYPGIWRNLATCIRVAKTLNFDQIFNIEWDFRILNPKMMEFITTMNEGLQTFWSPRHNIPESAFTYIHKNMFDTVYDLAIKMQEDKLRVYEEAMEIIMPWTHIHKNWIGDRYTDLPPQNIPSNADFCANYLFDTGFNLMFNRTPYYSPI